MPDAFRDLRRRFGHRLWRAAMICVAAVLLLLVPRSARADTWGQYLVILDDSGSMERTDPRRLVVMASMALGAALEDGDQVMLVGLNELASGDVTGPRFVSPRDLLSGRDGPEGTKPIAGERPDRLSQHQGQTPCREALDRAQTILESVASSGAPQTLLLLTDGACNRGAVEPAATWLAGLTSHREKRFRFVLLTRKGGGRVDKSLVSYGAATGWTGDPQISFDARALLRAFAEVLSFSRGLKYDDGGRVGLERTFAGARNVRVLAISEQGSERIDLAKLVGTKESKLTGGPTFRHAEHEWSLRVARVAPQTDPFSVRSPTAGVDVLVIPSYGALKIEAVVGPCGERPPLPWTTERAVRAGQPACTWARLVGDAGETIVPGKSFAFDLELCDDQSCKGNTAMQPDADGTFNAQIGTDMPIGRHERWFRAHRGALAQPVTAARGFQSMAFGIQRVVRSTAPEEAIDELDLGPIPKATSDALSLEAYGSFPAGAKAAIDCSIEGDTAVLQCITCEPLSPELDMQDPIKVQLKIEATSFCPLISESQGKPLAVKLEAKVTPKGEAKDQMAQHVLPIRAELQYAAVAPGAVSVVGGSDGEGTVTVPSPVNADVQIAIEGELPGDLEVTPAQDTLRMRAEPAGTGQVTLRMVAEDCCSPDDYAVTLVLTDPAGGPPLRVPVTVTVEDPGWWTCPGKTIAFWAAVVAAIGTLIWIVRGFISPAKFAEGAVLARADSHKELSKLSDGDEDWRLVRAYDGTKRGFYKPATVFLGGSSAPLSSLRSQSEDARIEARSGGGASLVVEGPGVETFSESKGWTEVEPGEKPIHTSLTLRRGDTYLLFRR